MASSSTAVAIQADAAHHEHQWEPARDRRRSHESMMCQAGFRGQHGHGAASLPEFETTKPISGRQAI